MLPCPSLPWFQQLPSAVVDRQEKTLTRLEEQTCLEEREANSGPPAKTRVDHPLMKARNFGFKAQLAGDCRKKSYS